VFGISLETKSACECLRGECPTLLWRSRAVAYVCCTIKQTLIRICPDTAVMYSIVDHQGKSVVVSSHLKRAAVQMHLFTCSAVDGSLRIGDRPHAQDHQRTCVAVSGNWAAAQHLPDSFSAESVCQCISIWLLRISFWSNAYERRGICGVASRNPLNCDKATFRQLRCTICAANLYKRSSVWGMCTALIE
jgi:hypothetical protein